MAKMPRRNKVKLSRGWTESTWSEINIPIHITHNKIWWS